MRNANEQQEKENHFETKFGTHIEFRKNYKKPISKSARKRKKNTNAEQYKLNTR